MASLEVRVTELESCICTADHINVLASDSKARVVGVNALAGSNSLVILL